MSHTIQGMLFRVSPTEKKTDTFSFRKFLIVTSGQYPQTMEFQLNNDRCSLIDGINPGTHVDITFDIKSREYQDKYYNTLQAWQVKPAEAVQQQPAGDEDISDAEIVDATDRTPLPF